MHEVDIKRVILYCCEVKTILYHHVNIIIKCYCLLLVNIILKRNDYFVTEYQNYK